MLPEVQWTAALTSLPFAACFCVRVDRVVLMSQVWGHVLNEWRGAPHFASLLNWVSIGIILSAVVVLGVSSSFK